MNKSKLNSEFGNGMFEMVLFIPLALLIMFVGTDIGLSKLDQAMISDAVREGMHSQILNQGSSLYRAKGDSINLDYQLISQTAVSIADRVASSIISKRTNFLNQNPRDKISVHVSSVELDINESSGQVSGYTIIETKNSSLSASSITAPSNVTFDTDQTYLNNKFSTNSNSVNNAGIIAPAYLTSTNPLILTPSKSYLKKSVGYLISVEAISISINPGWLDTVLGSQLGYQIKEFELVRN